MPLIVTPARLARQAEFYHQFAAMLAAGVGVVQTLEHLRRAPPAGSFRKPLGLILGFLGQGTTFHEAVRGVPGWLPSFDLALIEAGEQSGRLDAACRLLAEYYSERATLARKVISDLLYPLFILHLGVFILPLSSLFRSGNVAAYLRQTVGVLAPLYVLVFALVWACQGRHGEVWRSWIERVLHPVPVLGKARRHLALARLVAALEALLNAGVAIVEAWELASAASGSPALRAVVAGWRPRISAGETPAELLQQSPQFPELFTNLYSTGEVSGTLDDTLKRLHRYYQDEASRKLRAAATWTPRLVYFAILLLMAYQIVGFWMNYYAGVTEILGQ